jgi:hypothetical protein
VIRTAVLATLTLSALSLSALAAPAFAFETQSVPAPKVDAPFTNMGVFQGMTPGTTTAAFHFGPAEPQALTPDLPQSKKPTVVYELPGGKAADRIDVTDPRDNPFMPRLGSSAGRSPEIAH